GAAAADYAAGFGDRRGNLLHGYLGRSVLGYEPGKARCGVFFDFGCLRAEYVRILSYDFRKYAAQISGTFRPVRYRRGFGRVFEKKDDGGFIDAHGILLLKGSCAGWGSLPATFSHPTLRSTDQNLPARFSALENR